MPKIVKVNCPICKEKIDYNMAWFGDDQQHLTHKDHCFILTDSDVMKELERQNLVRFDKQNNKWIWLF